MGVDILFKVWWTNWLAYQLKTLIKKEQAYVNYSNYSCYEVNKLKKGFWKFNPKGIKNRVIISPLGFASVSLWQTTNIKHVIT